MKFKMMLILLLSIYFLISYHFGKKKIEKYDINKKNNNEIKIENGVAMLKDIGEYKKYLNYVTPNILNNKYNDISLFIYYIQHLYIIDTRNFESIVKSFDYFITIYESLIKDKNDINGYKFLLLLNTKNKIITDLNLFTFSVRFEEMNQINKNISDVNKILLKYIDEIKSYYVKNINENGYNVFTKIIFDQSEPAPSNILFTNYYEK